MYLARYARHFGRLQRLRGGDAMNRILRRALHGLALPALALTLLVLVAAWFMIFSYNP